MLASQGHMLLSYSTDHRRRTGPPDHRTGDGRPDFEVIGEGLRQVRGYDGEPAWQLALVRRQRDHTLGET